MDYRDQRQTLRDWLIGKVVYTRLIIGFMGTMFDLQKMRPTLP